MPGGFNDYYEFWYTNVWQILNFVVSLQSINFTNIRTDTMEQLLHYVWKHKLFPLHELLTSDGQTVEVLDPGLHNRNSGPDFFNAKVRIGDTLWVGNVEIHDKSSDFLDGCSTDGTAGTEDRGHTQPGGTV